MWVKLLANLLLLVPYIMRKLSKGKKKEKDPQEEEMIVFSGEKDTINKLEIKITKTHSHRQISEERETQFDIRTRIQGVGENKTVRSLFSFKELHVNMVEHYRRDRFPRISTYLPLLELERLESNLLNDAEEHLVINQLEEYLNSLLKGSVFINDVLLDFLGIPEKLQQNYLHLQHLLEQSEPHITFEEVESMHKMIGSLPTNLTIDQDALQKFNPENLWACDIEIEFMNTKFSQVRGEQVYFFKMNVINKQKIVRTMTFFRTFKLFIGLSKRIENNLIDIRVECIDPETEINSDDYYTVGRHLEAFCKYLFSHKEFYCPSLFDFFGIDPLTLDINNIDFILVRNANEDLDFLM